LTGSCHGRTTVLVLRRQKRKDKRSDIVFGRKPKRFGIVSEFVLLKTDPFDLVQNLLSRTKKIMISFDKTKLGTNSNVLVSFLLDIRTFVERLKERMKEIYYLSSFSNIHCYRKDSRHVLYSWLNGIMTFVERLFLYCFGITPSTRVVTEALHILYGPRLSQEVLSQMGQGLSRERNIKSCHGHGRCKLYSG
jgi:hypothetical protein